MPCRVRKGEICPAELGRGKHMHWLGYSNKLLGEQSLGKLTFDEQSF